MSYCIVEVIYGVPVGQDAQDELESLGIEPEDVDVEVLYSAGGDVSPAYCGVSLDTFDEATDMALMASTIRQKPVAAEIAAAKKRIADLPTSVRSKIKDKLGVYFIFHSS